MSNSQYKDLDRLIKEFEEDNCTIRSERLIMKNYPKVLAMSAASYFEREIKNRCKDFIDNSKLQISSNYPLIDSLLKNKRPVIDQMFAKIESYDNSDGIEHLNAEQFYNLFGGQAFKKTVISNFEIEKDKRVKNITTKIKILSSLLGQEEKYDYDYAKQCDLKDELDRCTFDDAENAYLNLKLRRNRVAHDYINGLSDTFEDLQKFYNKAVIYVIALEETIKDLTDLNT